MAKNIFGLVAAGLILSGCAGVSYNGTSHLIHVVGNFYTESEKSLNDIYTIEGIKTGHIKVRKVKIGEGQYEFDLKGYMLRWQMPDSDLEKISEKMAITPDGKFNPDDNSSTNEETATLLNKVETEAVTQTSAVTNK